ncbi:hypothetical protein BU25DRAFT_157465 [Macroventuria anomochaeta]|uniref:Uncharacterized protein n=1 Tax=Macroventuria anomochaeta TaxID=301207 RepID=A0ACB6RT47_9PLEO|nr:uncharacterized protein BU25DRAFT_157465 [Macroventuria anomochaeta]KAF2624308.1 hypothetical protein BU25DRAFT_157465 [Macroventuria anomochaeta]
MSLEGRKPWLALLHLCLVLQSGVWLAEAFRCSTLCSPSLTPLHNELARLTLRHDLKSCWYWRGGKCCLRIFLHLFLALAQFWSYFNNNFLFSQCCLSLQHSSNTLPVATGSTQPQATATCYFCYHVLQRTASVSSKCYVAPPPAIVVRGSSILRRKLSFHKLRNATNHQIGGLSCPLLRALG